MRRTRDEVKRPSTTLAPWFAGIAGASLAVVACGTILDVGDSTDGPVTPVESTLDAADFPEGSTILEDGGVQLPDGAIVDGTAADSGDAAPQPDQIVPPVCPGAAACDRVVFVSSMMVKLEDAANAAAKCTQLAVTATNLSVKGRQFDAWISTAASPAATRLVHGTRPYKTSLGKVIANDWNDLTDAMLANSIFHDENGDDRAAPARIWTATSPSGAYAGPNCTDWTNTGEMAIKGTLGSKTSTWTNLGTESCLVSAYLYCVEK